MYNKFEAFMQRYFTPLAEKLDDQVHLKAIKSGMVGLTPFTILGSIFAIIPAIPNLIGPNNIISQFITTQSEIIDLPVTLSLGFLALYATITISYSLGNTYKLYIPGCVTLSTFAFIMLTIQFDSNGVPDISNFGAKGLFVAIFVGLLTVELYRLCKEKRWTIRMPEGVPDFVSSSFELIPTTLIVGGTFIILRGLFMQVTGQLPPQLLTQLINPLVGSMDSLLTVWLVGLLSLTLFFFGIHPSVLSAITSPIMLQFFAENVEAYKNGTVIPHFYAPGPASAFAGFTGSGITIGVVIAALLSKNQRYKKIGKISLIPSLFGINEPILFGLPIILNPIMFIPFVIGGNTIAQLPYLFMKLGWLDKAIFTPPYVGVFFEGFLTNGDWRSIVVNLVQLALSIIVYYPFFKIIEKNEAKKEKERQDKKETATLDDLELLDDLDLDF